MATIPTFESILLEVHQSLGLPPFTTKKKASFSDLGMPLDNYIDSAIEILGSIFKELDMDEQACLAASYNIEEFAQFSKAVELKTWTLGANQRQVLWYFLGYVALPHLARRLAFWYLAHPFDKGMPRGDFWYLPSINSETNKLVMPVTKVVDWLLDLLGLPMDKAKDGFDDKRVDQNHIERNIYNWKKGNIPHTAKIGEYLSDNAKLDFQGIFEIKQDWNEQEKFEKSLEFVARKKLDATQLRKQIAMSQPNRLELILAGTASDEEKQYFVEKLSERYAKPDMKTIRQRFLVARMVQDGYRRLLKFLCPDVAETCTDFRKNKVLQLISIFEQVYNLTIEAHLNCDSEEEENIWFENKLTPWDKEELFLAIVPSKRETAYAEVAGLLTRRFSELSEDSPLEDFVPLDKQSAPLFIERKLQWLKNDMEEQLRIDEIVHRLRTASPWRTLQQESSYWVVSQVAHDNTLSIKARDMAIQRMRELAATPSQIIGSILLELNNLLNCDIKERPKDAEMRVQSLIDEAQASSGYQSWCAAILQYKAKHFLAQNDFDSAEECFREALDACSDYNYGELRGEIARDTFAIHVANRQVIPNNHEKYYRNMLAYGMFEGESDKIPSLEDTAVWLAGYFWSDLYKPYLGYENQKPLVVKQAGVFIGEAIKMVMNGDWDGLKAWMKLNAKVFQDKKLPEVRGDTVLMSWLKLFFTFCDRVLSSYEIKQASSQEDLKVIRQFSENMQQAIIYLAEDWSKQINLSDFKGQTPLMLAANNGNNTILETLLHAGAEINLQDYLGRTAVHAAVASRSVECVKQLLAKKPDISKVAKDKNSFLHTAVNVGHPEIVRLLLEYAPDLLTMQNDNDLTPLELAIYHRDNWSELQNEMRKHNRSIGSKEDFDAIISLLTK
jgi:hypothetical protein